MKVTIWEGSEWLVKNSGVGRAMEHQRMILARLGIPVNTTGIAGCDVIHINHVFPSSVFAALWAKLLGKRVLWYGHSTEEDFRNSFVGSNLLAPVFRRWITFCYGLADAVITPTPYSRERILGYGIKKEVIALSNGIDTDFWCPAEADRERFREFYGLSPEDKVVLSVGHTIDRKGIREYIDLARALPDVTFFWFGHTDPALVPRNVKLAMERAPKNLCFPGFVGKEELRRAYRGCDAFCFMSHEETEGIVVLEALACGIPTLVRDIPVYEGWLEDRKQVMKCDKETDFAIRLKRVLDGEGEMLRENGFRVAQERDFEAMARKMRILYRELIPSSQL